MSNKTEQSPATETTDFSKSKDTNREINADSCNTMQENTASLACRIKSIFSNALKRTYVKAVLVVAILIIAGGSTAILATHFNFKNSTVNTVSTTATASPTELPVQKPVPATDEKLCFKKDKYTVEVGKTTKTELEYTSPSGNSAEVPNITYTSNNIKIATVDDKGKIKGVSTGTTSIVALSETGIYTTVPIKVKVPKSHKIEDVPMLSQGETYPSGCESVSSTMLLNYHGFDITTDDFINDYLPMADLKFNAKGKMMAPDAYSAFIGSPYSKAALGCFPPVIKNAMNDYFKEKNKSYRAVDVTGASMESLLNNYIANDQPVLIWATMWMQDAFVTYEWTVTSAKKDSPYKDGDTYQWLANEHCMVLTGYDENYYYLNDPLNYYSTTYSRSVFDDRYQQMGRCALVIEKTK